MTIDIASVLQHLQTIDLSSAAIGAVAARALEAAAVKFVKTAPGVAIGILKKRLHALAATGKIDAPTIKLLKAYAQATFDWVDEALPDAPGPEKMAAALDRLALVPYLGIIVRADRAGVQQILQAAYDAINQEAKDQAAALAAEAHAKKTISAEGGEASAAPAPKP